MRLLASELHASIDLFENSLLIGKGRFAHLEPLLGKFQVQTLIPLVAEKRPLEQTVVAVVDSADDDFAAFDSVVVAAAAAAVDQTKVSQ